MRWDKVKLMSLCDRVISGGTPKSDEASYYTDGTIPWLRTQEVTFNRIYDTDIKINENGLNNSNAKWVKENSVIVAMYGNSAGRTAIAKIPLTTNQACCNLEINPNKADYNFIYYKLLSEFEALKGLSKGAAQNNLNANDVKEFPIALPILPTQRKIANILSAYDDLIENNLKRIKLLEEKAFLMYKGIVREEKELKKVPLAQLATVTSSKRIFLSDYVEEGIPFYRSKEIITKSNFESIEKPLYITDERYTDIKEKFGVPVSGDLLITSVGTIGFVHLVNDDDCDFYFKDGNLIWIKNLNKQNLAYFLFFKFRTPEFKEMLNSVAIGSSQKALTIETVKKIEIEIPGDDSLIEFNQETKTIIKFIYNLQKQNSKLREARDILLPRLMNGQIEV
jgi:type I restriction enzyme S subunit